MDWLHTSEYYWSYFWTVWKRCAIHGDIPCPHDYFDHLRLFEYDDEKVRRIPNVVFAKRNLNASVFRQ